jgi:hypothetical protein
MTKEEFYNTGSENDKKSVITTLMEAKLSQVTIAFRKEAIEQGWDYDTMVNEAEELVRGIYEDLPENSKGKTIFNKYNILDNKPYQYKSPSKKEIEDTIAELQKALDLED